MTRFNGKIAEVNGQGRPTGGPKKRRGEGGVGKGAIVFHTREKKAGGRWAGRVRELWWHVG